MSGHECFRDYALDKGLFRLANFMFMAKAKQQPTTPEGLNLVQIMAHFSTEEKARKYLESIRWPDGPACVHCGCAEKIYPIKPNPEKKVRAGLYECGDCHSQFSVTVGTIFEKSKVPLNLWLVAWYMMCSSKKGFSATQLQRTLGLGSYRTAWFMMHRIRYALADPTFDSKMGGDGGSGIVEVDETFIGGKTKGKGRAYKGNKTAVITVIEREGGARSKAVPKVTGETLSAFLSSYVDPSARLMTDEYAGYKKPGKRYASHETVCHSREEYVRGDVHTNSAEGFFANMKRGITGIYHHVGSQYLQQYLAEFDFRYNTRNDTDGERTLAGLQKIEGKRLMLRRST